MRKLVLATLVILIVLFAAACAGGTATQPAAPAAQQPAQNAAQPAAKAGGEKTVTIGFTTSQTGSANLESGRQTNGFKQWMDEVNSKGGLKLADGTVLKFTSKSYDDESKKDRIQELYTKLINDDKADFLISPYSSGLADTVAVVAEQNGKIMITAGAASDSTHQQGYNLVYQTYTLTSPLPHAARLTSSVSSTTPRRSPSSTRRTSSRRTW
ncbi:MAG: ABC transporter substrate-binding protein [Anaerolineae bacterium]